MAANQSELGQRRYFPFGSDKAVTGASDIADEERYTSQRRVYDGGGNPRRELYHYGARHYLPGVGLFSQPDTVVPDWKNPQSLNRFAYVLNNPLRHVDPTGHDAEDPGDWQAWAAKQEAAKAAVASQSSEEAGDWESWSVQQSAANASPSSGTDGSALGGAAPDSVAVSAAPVWKIMDHRIEIQASHPKEGLQPDRPVPSEPEAGGPVVHVPQGTNTHQQGTDMARKRRPRSLFQDGGLPWGASDARQVPERPGRRRTPRPGKAWCLKQPLSLGVSHHRPCQSSLASCWSTTTPTHRTIWAARQWTRSGIRNGRACSWKGVVVDEPLLTEDMLAVDCEYCNERLKLLLESGEGGPRPRALTAQVGGGSVSSGSRTSILVPHSTCRPTTGQVSSRSCLRWVRLPANFGFPERLKTAAQLMRHIRDWAPRRDTVLGIDSTLSGFVVQTLVGGDYYVEASSVTWCNPDLREGEP